MSVRFETEACAKRLLDIQKRTVYGCLTYGKAAANKLVKEAKHSAPWDDHTHHARNNLNGGATLMGMSKVSIRLSHGMRYGVYLELKRFRHKGNLAVVYPTVQKLAPDIVTGWAAVVRKGGG